MKVRRLQLDVDQMARLSIEIQMARLSIDYKHRKIKEVQQHSARMNVSRTNPSLDVDMQSLRNNIGLKNVEVLTQDNAAQAVSQAQQAVKTIENNGDYIAVLPKKNGNPIAAIARQTMLRTRQPAVPRGSSDPTVMIKGNPGTLTIDWSLHDITISWDDYQAPVITLDPKPSVDIELAQEARIEFRVVEMSIPPEAGRTFDKEA
jgi:hypothetical protein